MSTLMESWPRRHRISVDDYYRMAEVGLLAPDARVELIEGEIIDMAPIRTHHCSVLDQVTRQFFKAVGDRGIVRVQGAVRLDFLSEPLPDLALLAPREDFYRHAHPLPADVLLLVEISDSTLRYDRDRKVPLYARHGIPESWIFDLQHAELRVYRGPDGETYRDMRVTTEPGVIPLAALPDVEIDLTGILRG